MSKEANMTSKTQIAEGSVAEYVTAMIGGQLFGLPISRVQDVFMPERLTRVPLSSAEIAGVLNLRGRIVTAIDVRLRLKLPQKKTEIGAGMSVVVDMKGELYSLRVDQVGEVLSLPAAKFERNPPTLDTLWREFSTGIYRLEGKLLVILDVPRLLDFTKSEAI